LCRQWNEENKLREALASPDPISAKLPAAEEEEDVADDASTKGGVLHEEQFHEIKWPGDAQSIFTLSMMTSYKNQMRVCHDMFCHRYA